MAVDENTGEFSYCVRLMHTINFLPQLLLIKSNGGLPKFDRDKGQLFLSLRYHESTSRINVVVMKASKLLKPKHHLRIGNVQIPI